MSARTQPQRQCERKGTWWSSGGGGSAFFRRLPVCHVEYRKTPWTSARRVPTLCPVNTTILTARCPKCGGEVHERDRTFHCPACHWTLFKTLLGRAFQAAEIEELLSRGTTGCLDGFRSRQGRPFSARLKLSPAPEFKAVFDFDQAEGPDSAQNGAAAAGPAPDFTGQNPLGACPSCGARVFEAGGDYLCEKAAGPARSCHFRVRKLILQTPIAPDQIRQLLAQGRTDLVKGFVSKKTGRKFDAFLAVQEGRVAFEFPPRADAVGSPSPRVTPSAAANAGGGATRLDFTGQQPLGKCPRCGARVFEGGKDYVCEHAHRSPNPCGFRTARTILEQPVTRDQMARLLAQGRSDLLPGFVSRKSGRGFRACLVLDGSGQVSFEFPPREAAEAGG